MTRAVLSPGTIGFLFGLLRGFLFFHGFRRRFLGLLPTIHSLAHGLCSFDVCGEKTAAFFRLVALYTSA
jgi:hypothetical protein